MFVPKWITDYRMNGGSESLGYILFPEGFWFLKRLNNFPAFLRYQKDPQIHDVCHGGPCHEEITGGLKEVV